MNRGVVLITANPGKSHYICRQLAENTQKNRRAQPNRVTRKEPARIGLTPGRMVANVVGVVAWGQVSPDLNSQPGNVF